MDFAILSPACFLISWMFTLFSLTRSVVHERAFVLAHHDALQRAVLEDREYIDGELLIAAQRERRRIHHLEVLHERLVEGDLVVARRGLVLHRIGGVHAVYLRRLEDDVGLDLAP